MSTLLAPLSPELREIVQLLHYKGLTERETAARLNLTRHEVRTRRAQAFALLRPHIACLVEAGGGI